MIVLVDNTVLSNFALVNRPMLLQEAFGADLAITNQAKQEFEEGVLLERVPTTDWSWLPVIRLNQAEHVLFEQFSHRVGAGEASCLAVASLRKARILTDDRRARKLAGDIGVSVSGTVGVLVRLVKSRNLQLSEANNLLAQMIKEGYRSPVENLSELL